MQLSRVWVIVDGILIGNQIYWTIVPTTRYSLQIATTYVLVSSLASSVVTVW
jgi:hypothetical protein